MLSLNPNAGVRNFRLWLRAPKIKFQASPLITPSSVIFIFSALGTWQPRHKHYLAADGDDEAYPCTDLKILDAELKVACAPKRLGIVAEAILRLGDADV